MKIKLKKKKKIEEKKEEKVFTISQLAKMYIDGKDMNLRKLEELTGVSRSSLSRKFQQLEKIDKALFRKVKEKLSGNSVRVIAK
jgi:predicted transcriptional regulator